MITAQDVGMMVAISKTVPDTAAQAAYDAQLAAEAAAEVAQAHAWGVTYDGTGLVFTPTEEDEA